MNTSIIPSSLAKIVSLLWQHLVRVLSHLFVFSFVIAALFFTIRSHSDSNLSFFSSFRSSSPVPPPLPTPPLPQSASLNPIVDNITDQLALGFADPPESSQPAKSAPLYVHEMSDQELLKMVSRSPFNAEQVQNGIVPKVAFMFLAKGALPLVPLWEKFFKGHEGLYSIYVHYPPSYNGSESEKSTFFGRRIPSKVVTWGNVNMIEAERRLLASALLDTANQRFVLLSDSCIPLFNFSSIYSYLINSIKSSYIEVYDARGKEGRGRYRAALKPLVTIRQWRKGSQWFEMNRFLAKKVVSDRTYFPAFQRSCKRKTCYADEHYLPTLMNIEFRERNAGRSLTWVDWSKGGAHPVKFIRPSVTPEFLERLRIGGKCEYNGERTHLCFLFARKFTLHALDRLLWFAPKVMHFDD